MNKLMMTLMTGSMLAATGCLSNAVTFCPSSVPMEQGKYAVLADEVTGTCTQVNWLFFTFGAGGSCQRHAYADALSKVPDADGLVGMAVDEEIFAICPGALPTFLSTRVTGTPVRIGRND